MKSHLLIAVGLLIASSHILIRGLEGLNDPGLGLREVYILEVFLCLACSFTQV